MQIYGMGISRYEGLYIGLPWMFHISSTHRIDVQLTSSRDGRYWRRAGDRRVFLPNGPGESWDAGIIFTASQPVQLKDDQIFIFYSASMHNHNYAYLHRDEVKKGTPQCFKQFCKIGTSIGVATLRRDGFVSLDAGAAPGEATTKTFVWPPSASMHLNADAAKGKVQVDVLNTDGTPVESVVTTPVAGDQLDAIVLRSQDAKSLAGREVRLHFRLQNASLYSWWLAPQMDHRGQ